ncbi:MAG: Fur family transcriptional regulator [Candidatus Aminicenantes bacterium]|jgi:Fur family peroxide stress response transcriptional regulator
MKLNLKNNSIDVFKEKCRKNNLKITPQRIVIYRELKKSKDHPHAEALYKRINKIIPDISLDTVNRTLLTFLKIGIVCTVEGYGEPRRFDPDIENHHHFRCVNCNTIIDFDYRSYENINVPEKIKKENKVLNKKILLEGYCHKCRKRI